MLRKNLIALVLLDAINCLRFLRLAQGGCHSGYCGYNDFITSVCHISLQLCSTFCHDFGWHAETLFAAIKEQFRNDT